MKESQQASSDPEIESIELTQEEIDSAIIWAKRAKLIEIKKKEYFEKVNKEQEIPKFTAYEFYEFIKNKARKAIKGFSLTEPEKEIYKAIAMYFVQDERFETVYGYNLKKGLILYGNIGCGKTTLMNLFIDNPLQSYAVIHCRKVSADFQKEGVRGIERYYDYVNPGIKMMFQHQDLGICFDDLGTESTAKNYGNESNVMADIILSRYEANMPTHITTNLSTDQIEEYYGPRVRSRMREMFNLIEFPIDLTDKRK